MEEENKIEKAVKELLYEQALRERLQNIERKKKVNFYLLSSVAALFILLVGYFIINGMLNKDIDRNNVIVQNYEFPTISKSRSSEINIIDSFIPELNLKNYEYVLSKLNRDSLSEKDLFAKAHLYFVLDSLDISKDIIQTNSWLDTYHKSEIDWLLFLIEYKEGKSKNDLMELSKSLVAPYKGKAEEMLK